MKTAVIMPVKDELSNLPALLDVLYPQLSMEDELIAVDAGSSDGCWEFLTCYAATHPQLIALRAEGAFPGEARNVGIDYTDAEIIAQIDGGNRPGAQWLEAIRAPILAGQADYVTGNSKVLPIWKTLFGKAVDVGSIFGAVTIRGKTLRHGPKAGEVPEGFRFEDYAAGGDSVCYRRELWERAGGFAGWLRFGADPLFVRKVATFSPRHAFVEDAVSFWQLGPGLGRILERRARAQHRKLRTPAMVRTHLREVVLLLLLGLGLLASVFWTALQPYALAGLLIPAALQAGKSLRTWFRRTHPEMEKAHRGWQLLTVCAFIPALDILNILARVYGTAAALVRLPKAQEDWDQAVTDYLASPLGPGKTGPPQTEGDAP